jgi:para-nitrobenzyl esterase
VHTWLGIPYAEPPAGDLRWKAPRRPLPWEGRKETLEYGDQCPQLPAIAGSDEGLGYVGSDDCLRLNVWAPTSHKDDVPTGDEALPVMFWIHGGGNTVGSGGSELTRIYDGSVMASEQNVIVVSVNYRLGPMGWFFHDALRDTSDTPEDASGNYGTLDLIAALGWVRENIAVFGGNPANVTLFGESAGGFNVLSLMASPPAKGLFHKAIVQSGRLDIVTRDQAQVPWKNSRGNDVMTSQEMTANWLVQSGRAPGKSSAMVMQGDMDAEELSAWLRTLSLQDIFRIFGDGFAGMIQMPRLIGDGYVLPEMSAVEIFSDPALYANVPVILGTNRDEVALFMAFRPEYVESFYGLPMTIKNPAAYKRDVKYGTRWWRVHGVDDIAQAISQDQPESVFSYRFDADDWRDLGFVDFKELFGAAHAVELFFVFGYFPNSMKVLIPDSTSDEVALLSNSMMSYWAQFARTGNPGAGTNGEENQWLPWVTDAPGNFIVLDTDLDGGIRMEREILTKDGVRAAFLAEDFGSPDEKCQSYQSVFSRSGFDQAEYESLGCQ